MSRLHPKTRRAFERHARKWQGESAYYANLSRLTRLSLLDEGMGSPANCDAYAQVSADNQRVAMHYLTYILMDEDEASQ